ncbi:MAG: Crp/Fnr family transcriptional regulator [Candidatus Methylomirabilota bacterium]|nr:Crp/Fnr family transcriptional regulator [Candidatus Methylomirabilis sp.]NJD68956.1 Crp/Fnr family transcriptional regulator [candidate division NC10 bacterium]PWB48706.1 MAG: Crp/Fnr family transcriptional regulator [candidate division NC10 bacterium]
MSVTVQALRQIPYFAELGADLLRDLAGQVRVRTYRTGEIILLEGEVCEGLYFVLTGRVKVFKLSSEGREQVLRILGPGRTFNDVPVFDGGSNPAGMAAIEESAVGFVPKEQIIALVEKEPTVAKAVIGVLASRLRALTLLIEDLSLRSVVARVAKVLLDYTRGYETLVEGGAGASAKLTQQQIAAMTGSVREVVQRALKVLERDGVIKLERAHVFIVDPKALERWSE